MDQADIVARAAWLYHVEGLTQAEIAERLGLTRRRVNEMLASALKDGLVSVSFNTGLADCMALEAQLREAFGLEDAVVAPTPADPEQLHSVLGRVAAGYLGRTINKVKPRSLGVGWGATLKETVHFMAPMHVPGLEVHSMMGGLTQGSEINTFEIVRGFAQVLGARCSYLVAPIYAESAESRDAIISQTVFRRTFAAISEVDIAFLSVGDVSDRSLQVRYGLPEGVKAADLKRAGAVGDIIGRYLDANGEPVAHDINAQVLAPELDQFRRIPCRIVASGGAHKREIVKAVVKSGLATALVTDEETARTMLAGR
ncbi:RNA polymerase sigma70 [Devosia geojensis]|uniref:RNA polymerase sigma70 n=1 Tax=Devosia geojensis TaxID=443610 RepID=A0A0F5FY70_9HYPH|nr:sugar-binding transcriptional regulator [Devosia geojensis]KKB13107.1 RNA polymerase sigma70 [Devosia geojensis]